MGLCGWQIETAARSNGANQTPRTSPDTLATLDSPERSQTSTGKKILDSNFEACNNSVRLRGVDRSEGYLRGNSQDVCSGHEVRSRGHTGSSRSTSRGSNPRVYLVEPKLERRLCGRRL